MQAYIYITCGYKIFAILPAGAYSGIDNIKF